MSTIQHLFNRSIIIKRLKATSGLKRHMVSTGTIDAHVRRTDLHTDQTVESVYGASFKAYVDISADIRDGDDVLVTSGPFAGSYSVVAVIQKEPDIAINEHLEIIMRKYSS